MQSINNKSSKGWFARGSPKGPNGLSDSSHLCRELTHPGLCSRHQARHCIRTETCNLTQTPGTLNPWKICISKAFLEETEDTAQLVTVLPDMHEVLGLIPPALNKTWLGIAFLQPQHMGCRVLRECFAWGNLEDIYSLLIMLVDNPKYNSTKVHHGEPMDFLGTIDEGSYIEAWVTPKNHIRKSYVPGMIASLQFCVACKP